MHQKNTLQRKCLAAFAVTAVVAMSFFVALSAQAQSLYSQDLEITPVSGSLSGIVSHGSTHAVVVGDGGTTYLTQDGGDSWSDIGLGTTADLVSVDTNSSEDIMVILSDAYETYYTTGTGTAWTASATVPSAGPTTARDIAVVSKPTWYVVGNLGTVYKTTDTGATWASHGVGGSYSLNAVDFTSANTGVVVGDNGAILTTSDGGTTWTSRVSTTTEDLHDVKWISSTVVWAVGDNATVVKSTNAGLTWVNDTVILGSADLYGLDRRSTSNISFVGDGSAHQTEDGGDNWTPYASALAGNTNTYYDVTSPVSGIYWAVGSDASGNMLVSKLDSENPVISSIEIDGGSPDNDTTPQINVTATDNADTSNLTYHYSVDGVLDNSSTLSETSLTTALSEGTYTIGVVAEDAAGNESDEVELTYVLDLSAPSVGAISPISATTNQSTTFSVTTSDTTNLDCDLYINSAHQGAMTDGGDTYTYDYTFTAAGNYSAYAECEDQVHNVTTGSPVTITVAEASTTPDTDTDTEPDPETDEDPEPDTSTPPVEEEAVDEAEPGNLIKMACSGEVDVNDPCRAVYFYASDGKRHAFPNEKVYFTWYENFDDVIIVTDTFMASLSLGTNVTYRPGIKMVKFLSVNTVYAVEKEGVLRAIGSEDIAASLYGSDWNTKIDDINDAFFGNYRFGDDIDSTSDYNVDDALSSVSELDDNF